MRLQPVLLVLIGLLAGYIVATPTTATAAGGGSWQCYVADRLPDTKEAMNWKGATNVTDGLNAAAPTSPPGTIITLQYPTAGGSGWSGSTRSDVGLICVRS
jgi:hypothetical protein